MNVSVSVTGNTTLVANKSNSEVENTTASRRDDSMSLFPTQEQREANLRPSYKPSMLGESTILPTFTHITTEPSILPTPSGDLGRSWWFLTSAKCTLLGNVSSASRKSNRVESAIDYTFQFILKDNFDDDESLKSIIISLAYTFGSPRSSFRARRMVQLENFLSSKISNDDENEDEDDSLHDGRSEKQPKYPQRELLLVAVSAWSLSLPSAQRVSVQLEIF